MVFLIIMVIFDLTGNIISGDKVKDSSENISDK